MRKILRGFIGVPATLLAVAIVAAGALFAYLRWRDSQAASFASSVVAENSPIAEFASRRIVWKVVRCDSSVSSDTMRETYEVPPGSSGASTLFLMRPPAASCHRTKAS